MPASLDDMNKLGVRDITRGEAIAPMMHLGQEERARQFQKEVQYPYQREIQIAKRTPIENPVQMRQQMSREQLMKNYQRGVQSLTERGSLPPGHPDALAPDEVAEGRKKLLKEFSLATDAASGKGIYGPASREF